MGWEDAWVSASVLQGSQILELMIRGIGKEQGLKVVQRLELFPDGPDQQPIEMTETVSFIFPEKFRSDISTPQVRRIHLVSGERVLTVIDGKITSGIDNRYNSYKDVLLYRRRPLLQDRLASLGMDAGVSSLGRFQGQVAFVVGARYPDLSVTQLWVEKETFHPMRWLLAGNNVAAPEKPLDIRYFDWQPVGKVWYPMRIEFYREERLERIIHVDEIQVNPTFADTQFDPAYLESAYRPASPVEVDHSGNGVVDEIQQAIVEFNKIYDY
jgi:outer membrane lipoprotein-sorting protein